MRPPKRPTKKRNQQGRTRDRTKWKDDPHVHISPAWLRAVMREQGLTVSEIARRSGVRQQTVDAILRGSESRTTRRSNRAALAKALNVADELLAGEGSYLPHGSQLGYEYHYSARTRLAAQRLFTRCDKAVRRDVERGNYSAEERSLAPLHVEGMLSDLMEIGSWRERVLRWTPARHPRQGYREPLSSKITETLGGAPIDDALHEEGILSLIRAIEHVLQPWIDDLAALDYAAIREFTTHPPAVHTRERERPTAVILPLLEGTT